MLTARPPNRLKHPQNAYFAMKMTISGPETAIYKAPLDMAPKTPISKNQPINTSWGPKPQNR